MSENGSESMNFRRREKMTKDSINRVVKYVLSKRGNCCHNLLGDCGKCVGQWIRKGIKKVESVK